MPSLLITRALDLARFGLSWRGAQLAVGEDGGAVLETGDGATITLVLPPQAIAEQSLDVNGVAGASLSGTTQLCFSMPAGARIPLTADALFAALVGSHLVAAGADGDGNGTLLEVPANLISTIGSGGAMVSCTSAATARSGGVGLWQIDLGSPNGLLMLRPLAAHADDPALRGPLALTYDNRKSIVAAGAQLPATLTLSALGATFDAELVTAPFSWVHRAVLGRDEDVVIVEKGMLFPLGHRATKVTMTRRAIGADGFPAALHTRQQIIVTEPVRATRRQDFRFDSVEILTRTLAFATLIDETKRAIPPDLTLPSIQQRDDLEQKLVAANANVDLYVQQYQGGYDTLGAAGYPASSEYSSLVQEISELQADVDNPGPNDSPSGVAAVTAQLAADNARARQLWPQVKQEIADAKAQIDDARATVKSIGQQIDALIDQIKAITDATSDPPSVSFWPGDENRARRVFDVRLATPRGDLIVQMPLIFVRDIVETGSPYLADFASLTDPSTTWTLKQQWAVNKGGEVNLPGVAFDLVQEAQPQAGDIHEIHKLAIEAAGIVGAYVPRIARIDAKIASLRALLPHADQLTSLAYNLGADAALSPLKPVVPIVVDFLTNADRSGGLVAPKFSADALSRTLGPAAASALDAAHLPDFTQLYRDTRLLGLSLGEIVDAARTGATIPSGPTIVPLLEGIRPVGATMTWKNLPLKAAGMFRPLPGDAPCYLDLEARIAGSDTTTSATVHNFALAVPGEAPLVTIGFGSLQMVQATGKPPAVHAENFSFMLGKELQLFQQLETEVLNFFKANDPGIVVRRTDNGIAAGYVFALPEVAAGVFLMRNLGVSIDVAIPFNGDPVQITLGFARADNPFALAVTIFGGGGFFLIKMSRDVVEGIDFSLDFGAFVAVSFAVAKGEVHAYGAVRLKSDAGHADFAAWIRLGGSLDVLGIVSVSIELMLMLEYDVDNRVLSGEATLVIEVHVLFFSRSVQLDSGKWILAGSNSTEAHRLAGASDPIPLDPASAQAAWTNYWQAFSTWTP